MPLSDVLSGAISWNEAWAYTSELLKDPTSHSYAAVSGWSFVPPMEIVAMVAWIETWANARRPKNTVPVRVDRPWLTNQPAALSVPAPTEEDLRQRQALAERLGLA